MASFISGMHGFYQCVRSDSLRQQGDFVTVFCPSLETVTALLEQAEREVLSFPSR